MKNWRSFLRDRLRIIFSFFLAAWRVRGPAPEVHEGDRR